MSTNNQSPVRDDRSISAVPDGTVFLFPALPSAQALGYFRLSLRDYLSRGEKPLKRLALGSLIGIGLHPVLMRKLIAVKEHREYKRAKDSLRSFAATVFLKI